MKFDEERWRTLAANKPDELHSYIPQSSISELFDEIERLERTRNVSHRLDTIHLQLLHNPVGNHRAYFLSPH